MEFSIPFPNRQMGAPSLPIYWPKHLPEPVTEAELCFSGELWLGDLGFIDASELGVVFVSEITTLRYKPPNRFNRWNHTKECREAMRVLQLWLQQLGGQREAYHWLGFWAARSWFNIQFTTECEDVLKRMSPDVKQQRTERLKAIVNKRNGG